MHVVALCGIGGIGKTELAVEYANRHLEDYWLIWRFNCEKEELVSEGYQSLADRLKLNIPEKASIDVIKQKVHARLEESQEHKPWLLIFDNVEKEVLDDDLPVRGGGIIITARDIHVRRNPEEIIQVGFFAQDEAIRLLEQVTGEEHSKEMASLAEEFHWFPLALNQVAHYIRETPSTSIARYLASYKQKKDLIHLPVSEDSRYSYTLQNVWEITFEKLKKEFPLVVDWLEIAACFAPESIPVHWLESLPLFLGKSDEIIRRLHSLSLISYEYEDHTFSLHRLMRKALLERLENPAKVLMQAANYLRESVNFHKDSPETWENGRKWFVHADAVASHPLYTHSVDFRLRGLLYHKMGDLTYIAGKYGKTLEYCNLAIEAYLEENVQNESEYELWEMKGNCLVEFGCLRESRDCLVKAIEICQNTSDDTFFALSSILGALSRVLHYQGFYQQAYEAGKEALDLIIAQGGEAKPVYHRLLRWQTWNLFRLGRVEEAQKHGLEALSISREAKQLRELGGSCNLLGNIYAANGDAIKAEALFEEAFAAYEKIFPKDHSEIALLNLNLGEVKCLKGEFEKGMILAQKGKKLFDLHSKENRFGILAMGNIGCALLELGQMEKALAYFEKSLQSLISMLGEHNSEVAREHKRIGKCLRQMGRYEQALATHKKAVEIFEDLYQSEHPVLSSAWRELGASLFAVGQYKEALKYCNQALIYWKEEYGEEHFQQAKIFRVVAQIYRAMGQIGKAQEAAKEAFLIAYRTYYDGHPHLKSYCLDLVEIYSDSNDLVWKKHIKKECYPLVKKTMGRWHPISRKMAKS